MNFLIPSSVTLFHDKISLALSVPDITAHVNQCMSPDKGSEYPSSGQWTSVSVPLQPQSLEPSLDHMSTAFDSRYDALPQCQYEYPGRTNEKDKKTVLVVEPDYTAATTDSQPSPSNALAVPDPSAMSGSSGAASANSQGHGWFNGLLGCLRPVWTIFGKANHDLKQISHGKF